MDDLVKSESNGNVLRPMSDSLIYRIGELNRAINNHELCLHYQPRYESSTGKLETLEALVRWNHPTKGQLYPDAFIPLAEEVGLISPLGLWVFEQVCKDSLRINKQLGDNIGITINVSPLQCEDEQQVQEMLDICDRHNTSLSQFEFEITEDSINFDKHHKVTEFCKTLYEAGAHNSHITAEADQTPLENLCNTPVNMIKVKVALIKKIGYDSQIEIIIKHLIELTHELKQKVIAVGIEHAYQRDLLNRLGCDLLQGFYMHKPAELKNITGNILRMQ